MVTRPDDCLYVTGPIIQHILSSSSLGFAPSPSVWFLLTTDPGFLAISNEDAKSIRKYWFHWSRTLQHKKIGPWFILISPSLSLSLMDDVRLNEYQVSRVIVR